MPVLFTDFDLENSNGIKLTLIVEAPIGTQIVMTEIEPGQRFRYHPNLPDIKTVKVSVVGDPDHTDAETLTIGGNPVGAYIETLSVRGQFYSISGSASVRFGDPE